VIQGNGVANEVVVADEQLAADQADGDGRHEPGVQLFDPEPRAGRAAARSFDFNIRFNQDVFIAVSSKKKAKGLAPPNAGGAGIEQARGAHPKRGRRWRS
jgi:hypothetical protein